MKKAKPTTIKLPAKGHHCCECMAVISNTTKAGIERVTLMNFKTRKTKPAYVYQNFTSGQADSKKKKFRIYLNYCPFCKKSLKNLKMNRAGL